MPFTPRLQLGLVEMIFKEHPAPRPGGLPRLQIPLVERDLDPRCREPLLSPFAEGDERRPFPRGHSLLLPCGHKDGLIRISRGAPACLKKNGVPYVRTVDGHAHDATKGRNNLITHCVGTRFLQRVFH